MGLLKNSMFFTAPPKFRWGFRHFGGDLGRFFLDCAGITGNPAAKWRLSAVKTMWPGTVKNSFGIFWPSPFFLLKIVGNA
ncbi:MAG TPA: hypothetical protein DEV98_01985 [Clostridiales bacterium]|nr:hypothetical protein [Clostridiales bacterium]